MSAKGNALDEVFKAAQEAALEHDADIYLYNGEISRKHDFDFIDMIDKSKKRSNAVLFLVTNGGDPDAGYKMARHLQYKYDSYTVVISGLCKSAGTLIAVGADKLAFAPYGELGPLDIQTIKTDDLAERQSGLTIQEALDSLTKAAVIKHGAVFTAIIRETGAIVSFQTAAKASADLVTGLFAPIFARIDPYDVGEKARAMRIATKYGERLATKTNNLKDRALDTLTRTYPSHSFAIDMLEAEELFENVRVVNSTEAKIAQGLGALSRSENTTQSKPVMMCLSWVEEDSDEKHEDQSTNGKRGKREASENLRRAKQAPNSAALNGTK